MRKSELSKSRDFNILITILSHLEFSIHLRAFHSAKRFERISEFSRLLSSSSSYYTPSRPFDDRKRRRIASGPPLEIPPTGIFRLQKRAALFILVAYIASKLA